MTYASPQCKEDNPGRIHMIPDIVYLPCKNSQIQGIFAFQYLPLNSKSKKARTEKQKLSGIKTEAEI